MIGPQPLREIALDRAIARSEHDDLGRIDDGGQVVAKQRSDVGNVLLDEAPVRAEQPRQLHLGIVDQQLQALADEVLGQQDQRALAQIVGAGLERQADHSDAPLARCHHLGDRMVDVRAGWRRGCAPCIGSSTSRVFARYIVARRSLGRHEPPNAKPGLR